MNHTYLIRKNSTGDIVAKGLTSAESVVALWFALGLSGYTIEED